MYDAIKNALCTPWEHLQTCSDVNYKVRCQVIQAFLFTNSLSYTL